MGRKGGLLDPCVGGNELDSDFHYLSELVLQGRGALNAPPPPSFALEIGAG